MITQHIQRAIIWSRRGIIHWGTSTSEIIKEYLDCSLIWCCLDCGLGALAIFLTRVRVVSCVLRVGILFLLFSNCGLLLSIKISALTALCDAPGPRIRKFRMRSSHTLPVWSRNPLPLRLWLRAVLVSLVHQCSCINSSVRHTCCTHLDTGASESVSDTSGVLSSDTCSLSAVLARTRSCSICASFSLFSFIIAMNLGTEKKPCFARSSWCFFCRFKVLLDLPLYLFGRRRGFSFSAFAAIIWASCKMELKWSSADCSTISRPSNGSLGSSGSVSSSS